MCRAAAGIVDLQPTGAPVGEQKKLLAVAHINRNFRTFALLNSQTDP